MSDPLLEEFKQLKRELYELNKALDRRQYSRFPFGQLERIGFWFLSGLERQVQRLVDAALRRLPHRW